MNLPTDRQSVGGLLTIPLPEERPVGRGSIDQQGISILYLYIQPNFSSSSSSTTIIDIKCLAFSFFFFCFFFFFFFCESEIVKDRLEQSKKSALLLTISLS
jgi:hypothetical protein